MSRGFPWFKAVYRFRVKIGNVVNGYKPTDFGVIVAGFQAIQPRFFIIIVLSIAKQICSLLVNDFGLHISVIISVTYLLVFVKVFFQYQPADFVVCILIMLFPVFIYGHDISHPVIGIQKGEPMQSIGSPF